MMKTGTFASLLGPDALVSASFDGETSIVASSKSLSIKWEITCIKPNLLEG